jgi:hypothetical protein
MEASSGDFAIHGYVRDIAAIREGEGKHRGSVAIGNLPTINVSVEWQAKVAIDVGD